MDTGARRVMISSTALDLAEHRQQVMDACLRLDTKPEAMEHMPAVDRTAVEESQALVDRADVYLLIVGWRYGHIPDGHDVSITELEFQRAVERGIPVLVFLMGDDHPITRAQVDSSGDRIDGFRQRAAEGRVRQVFNSAADLRALVVQSLGVALRQLDEAERPVGEPRPEPRWHRVTAIPAPPEPYIAHPYTLLQTKDLVGRRAELRTLTDWVTRPAIAHIRVLNVVAIGGMGKSALAWHWFHEVAPNELRGRLAGRLWWSFYESDASFESFVVRALAYVTGRPEETLRSELKPGEREDELLAVLDREPHLLVLDGLERILVAYARLDAARLLDDDLDDQTMNLVYAAHGIPEDVRDAYLTKHRLRLTSDPRVGTFLRRLARCRAARVLVTTRLYPADLQTAAGQPAPGCASLRLTGLSDDDTLTLWREFGVTGSTEQLAAVFRSVANYPLLVRALAGEVAGYRPAPGDFDAWRRANPHFDPARLDLSNARTHILAYALQGLDDRPRSVLHSIAAFRMPASYETLRDLHVGPARACGTEQELDLVLTELEDRGLLGWDRVANRYDLHPIVRSVVWDRLDPSDREQIHTNLHSYFDAVPKRDSKEVERFEDLAPAVELYRSLIGLGRFDDALNVFRDHLEAATLYRLSASRQRVELLEPLFVDGETEVPRLSTPRNQSYALNALAGAYKLSGQPARSLPLFRLKLSINEEQNDHDSACVGLLNLIQALTEAGRLQEAHRSCLRLLNLSRQVGNRFHEAIGLYAIGKALAVAGIGTESEMAYDRAIRLFSQDGAYEGVALGFQAEGALLELDGGRARQLADRAWELAGLERAERDIIRAARIQGAADVLLGRLESGSERLHFALARAQAVSLADEELLALIGLAEIARQRGRPDEARELLDGVWEPATLGQYPRQHADAWNLLARIELDAGDVPAATAAARRAYELAWCDGPPYAYALGLQTAADLLRQLGAPKPALPPFDPANYEPLPDVEIDPPERGA